MGVPVFFKWMCMRNPKILRDAIQSPPDSFDSANPYIDNFYVDMNGLIHPACNPKGQNIKQPSNFEQQCQNIYEYMDKLINIIRPRKLLYLAIDGVAPRAKMNQQRSRRFRAAMQGDQMKVKKMELLKQYKARVNDTSEIQNYINKTSFDSNLITPGTTFLDSVGQAIRKYVKERLAHHRLWKNLAVIFSDASCPGQGQHKIMDFIRQERASQGYDVNQHHCIYGADADLIMLGLATHQPRFYIIRQVVMTANQKFCSLCGKRGHYFIDCRAAQSIQDQIKVQQQRNAQAINVSFQFINLKLIRQYMQLLFLRTTIPFGYNIQRIIDDFIFMCFFVGNDFLPHIPCLTIRQGGIDILMKVYDYSLALMPDYLINAGQVNFDSLKIFIREMTVFEPDIVDQIIIKQKQGKDRDLAKSTASQKSNQSSQQMFIDYSDVLGSFKQQMKKMANQETNLQNYSVFSHQMYGYKQKYYQQKFRIKPMQFVQLRHQISTSYMQALQWICHYYFKGVASWSWYYPFHYAPFFSDLNVVAPQPFDLGFPFKPFQQLVAVLPQKTAHALPQGLRDLMTNTTSPIVDYFPKTFAIDLVGKKFAWLGEVLLPFIDDKRLLRAMGNYQQKLTAQQKRLNRRGIINLMVNKNGLMGRRLNIYAQQNKQLNVVYEDYMLEGKVILNKIQQDVTQWQLIIPEGRQHSCKLKEGIQFNLLEELNQDFMRKTDRKAYGGQRFIRVIDRALGKRIHEIGYSGARQRSQDQKDYRGTRNQQDRSRSRQKRNNQPSQPYSQNDRQPYQRRRSDDRRRPDDRGQHQDRRRYDDRRRPDDRNQSGRKWQDRKDRSY